MKQKVNFKVSGKNAYVEACGKTSWVVMQEWFATDPFYEVLSIDDIVDYYNEFLNGGIYVVQVEFESGREYPVSLLSWKEAKAGEHPLEFSNISDIAYISDSMTLPSYRKRGLQTILLYQAVKDMKEDGFKEVYLRTVENSKMNTLAERIGMNRYEKGGKPVIQITKTPRSLDYIYNLSPKQAKQLLSTIQALIDDYDQEVVDIGEVYENVGIIGCLDMLDELELEADGENFQKKFGKNIEETKDQISVPERRHFFIGEIDKMLENLKLMCDHYNLK